MAWITFQQVSKRYRDAIGVQDLDLRIRDGEIFVLIGPSGCGKTTALRRIVEGLEGSASGFYTREVRAGGRRTGFELVTLEGERALLATTARAVAAAKTRAGFQKPTSEA